jgi:single-stranded-DNA-specific exonuclease
MIALAAERSERVVIYGDYDIDGLTASAIMIEGLAALGIDAVSYIPDRFEEGYGINQAALEQLQREGAGLVISVDCGITSVTEAAWAREHGLDLIITDHHTPGELLPEAVAVVNPKRPGDAYPWSELCGAGVAFKLVQALQQRLGKPEAGLEKWLLDLVALGTVCDIVELLDENRVLVTYGLRVLQLGRRPGIAALAAVAGVKPGELRSYHLGYVLGPRLNAAGRLEHASQALELLLTHDATRAAVIAAELDELNQRRRDEQAAIFAAANEQAQAYADDPVLVLADPDWSHGIVGIVASKLVEEHRKPVLVAQVLGDHIKGSARSLGTFNMVAALQTKPQLFTKFGGHFFAAGYTLPTENLEDLRAMMNEAYLASGASSTEQAELEADLELDGLAEANWDTEAALALLEPFGAGNPAPLVTVRGVRAQQVRRVGADGAHLRLVLADNGGRYLTAIGFRLGYLADTINDTDNLVVTGRIEVNEFRGERSLQINVVTLKNE